MKAWKRLGRIAAAALILTAAMLGTALAAEPAGSPISVQLNGGLLSFADAAPETSNGRTFIPLRAVMEAMEAQVDYDQAAGAVAIHRGGVDLSMVLGENRVTVTEDGQSRTLEMDVAPYVKNDRTYVPVRFVAESFGCAVGWDQDTRTVIIADVDALLGDAAFTLMDNYSAYCRERSKSENMTVSGTLELDVKDKSGSYLSRPVTARGSVDGITGDKGAQLAWELKMDGLSELMAESAGSPMEQVLMQQIMAALSNLKGELRLDLEGAAAYLSVPAELTGGGRDTWYSMDFGVYQTELLSGLDIAGLSQLEESGIREVLAAVLQSMPVNDSETSYAAMVQVVDVYKELLSDQAFTRKGNTYVAGMTVENVMDMTVTLTRQGDDIVSADIRMTADAAEGGDKMTMTMTEHAAPDRVTVEMAMTMENETISVKMDLDMTCLPTSNAPVTVPPAGAEIVPMA